MVRPLCIPQRVFHTTTENCGSTGIGVSEPTPSRAVTDKLTPGELSQLRRVSGPANWLGNQTRPDLCVSTSLLQGAHASATVADTREANKTHSTVSPARKSANSSFLRSLWTV